MKFKITAKKDDGSGLSVHYFDNQSLDIWTEQGVPVVLSEDPRCSDFLPWVETPSTFEGQTHKKSEKINTLRITLGFKCNFHCKYCLESCKEEQVKTNPIIPIHKDWDSKVASLVDRISKKFPHLEKITFWGGEPLVYFKLIKKLVPALRERYPDVSFSTITNGSLLTLPVAKYLMENKIHTTVSHDGPAFNIYRDDKDPLDDEKTLEGIRYILEQDQTTHFNIVVTPENADLQKIVPYFESKLGMPLKIHFESIVKLSEETKGIVKDFDEETAKTLLNNIVAFGSTPTRDHDYGAIRDSVTYVLRMLINKNAIPDIGCMIGDECFVAIDMDGNLLTCHGDTDTYGTIEMVDDVGMTHVTSWRDRENCVQCPFLVACRGGCTMRDTKNHEILCETAKIWYAGFFIAAWKVLFNTTICRIEPAMED